MSNAILYDKLTPLHRRFAPRLSPQLDKWIDSGANIVLSKLPIGDLATQYFADKGLFCAGRVEVGDMVRVGKATGAVIQTSTNGFTNEIIGNCGMFEEKQIGDERFNLFTECPSEETATIVLRGGSEQFIEEVRPSEGSERSELPNTSLLR